MGATGKCAVIPVVAVVAAAGALGGRLIGWRHVWDWLTGWWTPGWGNLFTVIIAAAGVAAAIANNRATRKDSRIEKLRAEIAALVTAIDEHKTTDIKVQTGIVDAFVQAGLPNPMTQRVAPQPTNYDEHYDDMRRAFVLAESAFEDTVSPIYRRIVAHAFGVLMLTDDPQITRPVERLDSATAAEWAFSRDLYKHAKESVNGMQFAQSIVKWAQGQDARKSRLAEIQAARDELRRYSLERFSKLEQQ